MEKSSVWYQEVFGMTIYYDDEVIAQAYKDNGTSNVSANTDKILETPENWWASSYYITKYLISKKLIHSISKTECSKIEIKS